MLSLPLRAFIAAGLLAALPAQTMIPLVKVPEEIATLPLETTADLGTRIVTDLARKTEGRGSIRVETRWPTEVNLGEVGGIEAAPGTLIFEADVRSDELHGSAYLRLWCLFPDHGQFFGRGLDSTVSGTTGWKTLRAKFFLQPAQNPSRVMLNLVVDGYGTVWVDRARLLRGPLP